MGKRNLGQSDSRDRVVKGVDTDRPHLSGLICKMGMLQVVTALVLMNITVLETVSDLEHSRRAGHSGSTRHFCVSEANLSGIKAVTELRAEGYGSPENQANSLVIFRNCREFDTNKAKRVFNSCVYLFTQKYLFASCVGAVHSDWISNQSFHG